MSQLLKKALDQNDVSLLKPQPQLTSDELHDLIDAFIWKSRETHEPMFIVGQLEILLWKALKGDDKQEIINQLT